MPSLPSLSTPARAPRGRECLLALMVAISSGFDLSQASAADTPTLSAIDRGWCRSDVATNAANFRLTVPEPSTFALALAGLPGAMWVITGQRRRTRCTFARAAVPAILLVSLLHSNARGETVAFQLTGSMSSASSVGGWSAGSPFTASYSFDSLAAGVYNPTIPATQYAWAVKTFDFTVAGKTYSMAAGAYGEISVGNNAADAIDRYIVTAYGIQHPPLPDGLTVDFIQLDFIDSTKAALPDESLVTSSGVLQAFGQKSGRFFFSNNDQPFFDVTSIAAVPEPASVFLATAGIAGLAYYSLQRRRGPRWRHRCMGIWASLVILTANTASAGVVINISEASGGTRFQISGTVTITSSGSSQQWNGFWLDGWLSGKPFLSGSNATITHPVIAGSGAISTTLDGSSAITSTQVFSNSYAFAFNTAYRTYAQGNTFAVSGDFTTSQPFSLFVVGNYSANRMGIPYTAPFITNESIAVNVVPEPSGCVLGLVAIVGVGIVGASRFRRLRGVVSSRSRILAILVVGTIVESNTCHAGPITYQYVRRSLSGYAQASGYARLTPEVVNQSTGPFMQSISGSSGVPGNYSAFAVSLDSNVPSDGSPVTATANWSSDWSLTPSTFGESGGGVLHRVDLSVATTTDFTITGSITNGSVYLWTTGYQYVFPRIDAGANVTKTVSVQGTLTPGYYMMFWDSAVGGGAGGTGHYDGAFNLAFAAVPEPSACMMVAAGLACVGGAVIRRRL